MFKTLVKFLTNSYNIPNTQLVRKQTKNYKYSDETSENVIKKNLTNDESAKQKNFFQNLVKKYLSTILFVKTPRMFQDITLSNEIWGKKVDYSTQSNPGLGTKYNMLHSTLRNKVRNDMNWSDVTTSLYFKFYLSRSKLFNSDSTLILIFLNNFKGIPEYFTPVRHIKRKTRQRRKL